MSSHLPWINALRSVPTGLSAHFQGLTNNLSGMKLERRTLLAHAMMFCVCMLFGLMNVVIEWGWPEPASNATLVDKVSAGLAFTFMRDLVAALALGLIALPTLMFEPATRNKLQRDFGKVCVGAIFFIGGMVPFVVGVALTNASTAVLFQPLVPVMTTAFAVLVGIEPRNWIRAIAILLAVAGTIVTIDKGSLSLSSGVGLACLVVNALSLPIWLNLLRTMRARSDPHDPLALNATVYLIGMPFVGLCCLCWWAAPGTGDQLWLALGLLCGNWWSIVAVLYCGLLGSALTYFLINFSAAYMFPSVLTLWCAAQPVATLPFAYAAFGEVPAPIQFVGCGLIAAGLLMCTAVSYKEERERMKGQEQLLTNADEPSESFAYRPPEVS